jgi:Flp pilus assembly protein TadG
LIIRQSKSVQAPQIAPVVIQSFVRSDQRRRNRLLAAIQAFIVRHDNGGALVELAVTLPIIFMIMTGIFSVSIALYQKLALAEAVSTGARFLATDRGDGNPCSSTAAKVYAAAPTLSSGNMTFSIVITNGTTPSSYTNTCAGAVMTTGGTASLQVTYPCVLKAWGVKFSACSLSTQVAEVIQ